MFLVLIAILGVARTGEVIWAGTGSSSLPKSMTELNYMAVLAISAISIPFAELVGSARSVLSL
jgi:hypothetical protein